MAVALRPHYNANKPISDLATDEIAIELAQTFADIERRESHITDERRVIKAMRDDVKLLVRALGNRYAAQRAELLDPTTRCIYCEVRAADAKLEPDGDQWSCVDQDQCEKRILYNNKPKNGKAKL